MSGRIAEALAAAKAARESYWFWRGELYTVEDEDSTFDRVVAVALYAFAEAQGAALRAELARAREEIDTVTADMDALRVVAEERAAQVERLAAIERGLRVREGPLKSGTVT